MKRRMILAGGLLTIAFVASCGLLDSGPATRGEDPAHEEKYRQALEYYELTRDQKVDLRELWNKLQDGSISEQERQTAIRTLDLEAAIRAWQNEPEDRTAARKDRQEVDAIVDAAFEDPASRKRMVLRSVERERCERITTHFYNGNRCFIDIVLYDRGPTAQAGIRLFLLKYEGRWKILFREDWIS